MSEPKRALLQEALAGDPSQIPIAAILEAIRALSDGIGRVAEQGAEHARILKDMGETLHNVDKRLMLLEHGGAKLDDHEKRLAALEAKENRRDGALGFGAWLVKNWPAILAFIALGAWLSSEGVVKL